MDGNFIKGKLSDRIGGIAGWVRWAISEKKVVYILVLALMAGGIYGFSRMSKDEFPTFVLKQGLVAGIYPGATAEEVEQQLTKPLEETLFSYKEVIRETTTSVTKDGICYLYVDLNCSQKKKDEVWSKIKLGLEARKLTLPAGVLAVAVLDDFSNTSALLIGIQSDDKGYTELQSYAEELTARLRQLPTLAKASIVGSQTEEIAVRLDREKISSYGIDPAGLFLEYQTASLSLPSGSFETFYTSSPIHISGGVKQETEIADRIVYTDPSGNVIRLKDIASIERRYRKPSNFVSHNGNACLVVSVEMRPGNDIVAFGKEVDKVLDKFSPTLPNSVKITKITDQPKVVGDSVFSFLRDLIISMLIVIFVMVLLFPIRSALIASSGVPVCTAIALSIMYVLKLEINTVTLAALIVCLGMIVDDSIITIDGYMDKIAKGYGKMEAACASAKELFMPTFIATAAICGMFYPMTFIIKGYLGDFVRTFPWIITIALMTSLVYAVSVVPSMEVRFIRIHDERRKKNAIERAQNWFFDLIQDVYEKCQAFCFRYPKATLAGGVIAVVLGLFMFSGTNIQMMPMAARDFFVIELETEGSYSIDRTKSYVDSLQSMLLADDRVETVTSFIGTSAPRFTATYAPKLPSPSVSQMLVNTTSKKATESLLKELEDNREYMFPGAILRYKQMDYNGAEAMIIITLTGDDRKALADAAEKIEEKMYSMNTELKWVHSNSDATKSSIEIALRPDEAAKLGVNKSMLSLSLAGIFDGQTVATLWEGAEQIPVNLYSEGIAADMDYSKVGDQLVATDIPGVSVPLRQIADIKPGWSLSSLSRFSGQEAVSVYADMKMGKSQPTAMKELKNFIDKEIASDLPEGTTVRYGGLSAINEDMFPQIAWSFFAAVLVLFIFLLFHFRKASLAALTLIMSLLCLFGAFFGLWIFGMDFTITAVLGLVSLVGIITRNGILMFEYAEEARFERGLDVRTAAMEAGKRRMRPIFLTSCTTALGVLPMIISGDLLWMPMGIVICFGTLLSIFLVVLIMPISYWQLFRNAPVVNIEDEKQD